MQNEREKSVVIKAYEVEKTLFQQLMLTRMIKEEINEYARDKRILTAVNKNEGYSRGKQVDEVEELAMHILEEDTPYQRISMKSSKPGFFNFIGSDNFIIFLEIAFILLVICSIIKYASYRGYYIRWIWTSYFWDSLFSSIKFGFLVAISVFVGVSTIFALIKVPEYLLEKSKIEKYNNEVDKNNKIIIERNNKLYKERMLVLDRLKNEYNYLNNKLIKDTKRVRSQIYKLGIIDEDYQNFVAVSSFYQYFRTGRVETLGGTYGAYNKYEEERRYDLIIQKLDEVIKRLDDIKKNQAVLYNAIVETQRTNEKVIGELRNIQTQNNQIIENTYITSYNTEIAAKNTEFLKWCEIFR